MTAEPDERECLWCGNAILTDHPKAVWCSASCRVQATNWRSAHRKFRRGTSAVHRRPRQRLWLTPRGPSIKPTTRNQEATTP